MEWNEEVFDSSVIMELPMDWENSYDKDIAVMNTYAESIPDGLLLSLTNLGKVDIEYIAAVTGEEYKTVISELKGSIYQNPLTWDECFYKGWETAEEYLSGNILRKWKDAQEANDNECYKGYFDDNIMALRRVLPPAVSKDDIYITLGSPWVPVDVIDGFIAHILKRNFFSGTKHDENTGSWDIPNKSGYFNRCSIEASHLYGTPRMPALQILDRTLNMRTVAVYDEVESTTSASGKKKVINQAETVAALAKQQVQIQEFQRWVWRDEKRKRRLLSIFESKYGCIRRRIFDGSFLNFPQMNPEVSLYPYQKNAVARILFSENTLLAHDVGSGKTFIMIAAGMELSRMGISKKNLYVVPNNIVGQWKNIFEYLYPGAKVLCVEPKTFGPTKRKAVLEQIQKETFDAIIMAYSCFEQIPLSQSFYEEELEKERKELCKVAQSYRKNTSKFRRRLDEIEKKLFEYIVTPEGDDALTFDKLGITRLFVDEAHNYKNLPLDTKVDKISGISSAGSKKCVDMLHKTRYIQNMNNGGGVVMATGTPITNSITDIFVMQKYLQNGELKLLDLQSFDSWIGMFGEKVEDFEIDVDTTAYRLKTRFAKFHNLPELTVLLSSIADFHQVDPSAGIPDFDGYEDSLIAKTPGFAKYLEAITERVEDVRSGHVSRTEDNMLKITVDGKLAALDLRLVSPESGFAYDSKVRSCAEKVFEVYMKYGESKGTQLIFCDSSTPKQGFNLYDELKRLLTLLGIPEAEIAYIHDANTEAKRAKLFREVCKGNIRVLIGSTFKLGLVVNVQDKLVAIHHLDVPWRPADMVQREGRILRQGNTNEKVFIYRYITEGSFDAYSWQLLETKQSFISELLSGTLTQRSGSDIEDTVLNYAEVKALAVGNPLIRERVEAANELSRYLMLQRKAIERHVQLEKEAKELPDKITEQEQVVANCYEDTAFYKAFYREYNKDERKLIREKLHEALKNNVLEPGETFLMEYQGFRIVLPSNMVLKDAYVWIERKGRYRVETGIKEIGGLIRIDNFLDGLEEYTHKMEENEQKLKKRLADICRQLTGKEDYADRIQEMKQKVAELDKQLGVVNHEGN